jgi:hypothetical protein
MIITSMARIALVSVIFAAPALAQAPAGDTPAKQDPAPKQDAPAKKSDTGKYAAITSLIREHREKQTAMVKLWREIKKGNADEKTRKKAAHFFHRDIDDWAFLKFFFYITPVQQGDGSHHFVVQSHRPGWKQLTVEGFQKKRWTDAQVAAGYGAAAMRELHGPAGMGFAEDTFGLHKAQSPSVHPRLLVSLVFQLNDYQLEDHHNLDTRLLLPADAGQLTA